MGFSKLLKPRILGLLFLTIFSSGCFLQTAVHNLGLNSVQPITEETPINKDILVSLDNTPVDGTTTLTHSVQVISDTAQYFIYKYGDASTIDCEDMTDYSAANSISSTLSIIVGSYVGNTALCVLGLDSGGNKQNPKTAAKHVWNQSWSPFVYIEKPGQGLVQTTTANLNIHAPAEWTEVYITDVPGCGSGGSWQSIAAQISVTLAPDGTTKVADKYVMFRKAGGVTSACYSDSISVAALVTIGTCSGNVNTDSPIGEFIDSGGSSADYSDGESCSVTITGGPKIFTFDLLDTEDGYDFVSIYKDSTALPANKLEEVSGNIAPSPVNSTSNTNIIKFESDGSVTAPGYKVSWVSTSIAGSSSIKIAGGAATAATRNVTLDIVHIGQFTQMYITNDSSCSTGGSWENIAASKPWQLTSGNGLKEVFIKFRDPVNVESSCESDSIILYDGPPAMATLTGAPINNSGDDELNVTVGGTDIVAYKFKVGLTSSIVCTDPSGYSAEVSISSPIDSSLLSYSTVSLTLCVLGVNPIGISQDISTPTVHTWMRNVPFMVQFQSSGEMIAEGATSVTFRVVSDANALTPITVSYDVYGDFVASEGYTSGTVTILAGQNYADITLPITSNPVASTDKRISVGISDLTVPHRMGLISTSSVMVIDGQRAAMGVTDIGYYSSCAILANGKLVCRDSVGGARESTYRFVEGFQEHVAGTTFKSIIVDQSHKCALSTADGLYCWGWGFDGQLGINNTNDQLYPQKMTGFTWKKVVSSMTWNTMCGIDSADDLYCWGDADYSYGALGTGSATDHRVPTLVDSPNKYHSVFMAEYSVCAIQMTTNELKCWGANSNNRLGDGTTTDRPTPVVVDPGVGYSFIDFTWFYTQGITTNGDWKHWGNKIYDGGFSINTTPYTIDSTRDYTMLASADTLACGLSNGDLYCIGSDYYNLMGFGTYFSTPTLMDSTDKYTVIKAGNRGFICGITTTSKLKCFGPGLTVSSSARAMAFIPHLPTVWDADTFTKLIKVNGGLCAVTTAGLPKCFFANKINSGLDTRETWNTRLIESTLKIKKVSNQYLIAENDKMYAWGRNVEGDYSFDARSNPYNIEKTQTIKTFTERSGYGVAFCYITTSDKLFCKGTNPGNGTSNSDTMVAIDAASSYTMVAPGSEFTCGVTTTGDLKCWGYNADGQLGLGTTTDQLTPQLVGTGFSKVSAMSSHACALKTTGELYCWGKSTWGIGNGTTQASTPQQINAGDLFTDIAVSTTMCAIRSDNGRVMCWGAGPSIGDGTASGRAVPTLVNDTGAYTKLYVATPNGAAFCGITGTNLKCWGGYRFPRFYSPTTVFTGGVRDVSIGSPNMIVGTSGQLYISDYMAYAPFTSQGYPKFELLQGLVDRTPPVAP